MERALVSRPLYAHEPGATLPDCRRAYIWRKIWQLLFRFKVSKKMLHSDG